MAEKKAPESSNPNYETIGYAKPILVVLAVFVTLSLLALYLVETDSISQNAFYICFVALLMGLSIMHEMINIFVRVARKIAILFISTILMVAFLSVIYLTLVSFLGFWQYFGFAVCFGIAPYFARISLAYFEWKIKKQR